MGECTLVALEPIRGEVPSWVGYGYGYGYGDGDGYGDGYGNGYGDGYGKYWLATVTYFSSKWTKAQRERLAALQAEGATIAFWRSDANGRPANGGGKIAPAAPGVVHTIKGTPILCETALHATHLPLKWEGERWWIVALIGEVIGDEEKFGAAKREIIGEAL